MRIAVDYDETYTRDPVLWNTFAQMAIERGHEVVCISARHPSQLDEIRFTFGRVIGADKCYGTGLQQKRQFADDKGLIIDVWVDDSPEMIVTDHLIGYRE